MNDRLSRAMDRLKAESANESTPADIEQALLAEFARVKHRRKRWSWTIAAGAVAASIAVVLIVEQRHHIEPPASPAAEIEESEQPFVPIPYVAPLGAYERAEIVRMQMPVAALIAAGLPMRTRDPGARAEADVVVGQDGRARAVRLISVSTGGE